MSNGMLKEFDSCCRAGRLIFIERQRQYGPGSIEAGGVLAAVIQLDAIVRRLKNLLKEPTGDNVERIEDALIDAHNYSGIGLIQLGRDNLKGDYG